MKHNLTEVYSLQQLAALLPAQHLRAPAHRHKARELPLRTLTLLACQLRLLHMEIRLAYT